MAPPKRDDPYSAFNFRLEIQGITAASFSECSGLSCEVDVIEYRSGGEAGSVRKLPGVRKYANIVLKRGITKNRELWDWYKSVLDGKVQRKEGSILLLNDAGQEVLRWNFHQGWPRKYEGPTLNASSSEVAIETIEIAHEGLELV
jgi:phage tail-like protein